MIQFRKAFTLLELIVALSISAVIGFFAISMAIGVVDVWNEVDNQASMAVEVQYALDTIARDLESAVFRERGEVMFAVDALDNGALSGDWVAPAVKARPNNPDPFNPTLDQYGWAGSWVRFFTAAPTLNAVGYQIIRSPILTGSSDIGYHLYRGVVRVDHTSDAGLNIKHDLYSSTGSQIFGNPGAIYSPQLKNFILDNVIDFGVRLFIFDNTLASYPEYVPDDMRLIFPADANSVLDSSDKSHAGETAHSGDLNELYPHAAEIVVRVLTSEGASLLSDLEAKGGSDEDWGIIVEEHSKVFRRFIDINSLSL